MDIERKLNSVGKEAFVIYYFDFKTKSREAVINKLVEDKVSNYDGASIRVGNAKQIFANNKQCEALSIIVKSKRLPSEVIHLAKKILLEECK